MYMQTTRPSIMGLISEFLCCTKDLLPLKTIQMITQSGRMRYNFNAHILQRAVMFHVEFIVVGFNFCKFFCTGTWTLPLINFQFNTHKEGVPFRGNLLLT